MSRTKILDNYPEYIIYEDGRVYSLITQRFLPGSRNTAGYHNFRLKQNNGESTTIGRHRLLAMAFLEAPGNFSDYVVNHKNLIKGSDALSNLEWLTERDNFKHAGELFANPKFLPIQVRDFDEKTVSYFACMIDCAREYGYTKDTVQYRVKTGGEFLWSDRKQYRLFAGTAPWSENPKSAFVLVRDVLTGEVTRYSKLAEAARSLDISPASATLFVRQDQPVVKGRFQMKMEADPRAWRDIGEIILEVAAQRNSVPVIAVDSTSNEVKYFSSAKECASAMGLKVTTLSERLRSSGTKVYSDGFSYRYYSPQ